MKIFFSIENRKMGQIVSTIVGVTTVSTKSCIESTERSCQHPANYVMFLPPPNDNIESDRDVEYCSTPGGRTVAFRRWIPNSYKNTSAARQKYIVWSHGNAMDIFSISGYFSKLSRELGIAICVYDYPGYSLSTGYPTESGCCENHTAVVKELMTRYYIDKSNIYLVGQSIGTGVVVDYIYRNKWTTPAMLISPYKSIFSIVLADSLFKTAVSIFDRFDSLSKMQDISCPIKIVHGIDDEIINISHGQALYAALNNKNLIPEWIPYTGHNDILNSINIDWYRELII